MFIAKCNLRINRETIKAGAEFITPPKGFEKFFEEVEAKETKEIQGQSVETASQNPKRKKRRKK